MSELIIAMSLFIIIITVASGTFVQSIRTQRDIVSSTSTNSNVTQALEQMAREIRTGYDFTNTTATHLNFTNAQNNEVNYELSANSIVRCIGPNSSCSPYVNITADKVKINAMKFTYDGTLPPRVTISIEVQGTRGNVVNFQTTVASRAI